MEDGVKVISISGNLESRCVSQFKDLFFNEIEGNKRIVLDFSKLDYLDSSGLATLVNIYKNLNVRNARMVMFGLSEGILRVVELTKLDEVFEISGTLPDALAKVKS
jgi:anti-sigma B factor antagonist